MTESVDVNHSLEEGLLHFFRGMILEARQSWRRGLQLDPQNAVLQDYLRSTDMELTQQERSREAEQLKQARQAAKASGLPWEDDDFEVIAAGPDDDDETSQAVGVDTVSITGFLVEEDELGGVETGAGVQAPRVTRSAAGGWVEAPEDDEDTLSPSARPVLSGNAPPVEGDSWEPLDWMGEVTPATGILDYVAHDSGVAAPAGGRRTVRAGAEPPPPPVEQGPSELLHQAREHLASGNPEAARELLILLTDKNPGFPGAMDALGEVVGTLLARYQEILGSNDGVPELTSGAADLFNLKLDEVGGYIYSRIDGIVTLDDLYTMSTHLDQLHVMRILVELLQAGVITLRR